MKPNDKAYAEARKVAYNRINKCFVFDLIKEAVDAAYAAQFQSENYAGLVKELREDVLQFNLKNTAYENIANEAADALETLLAKLNCKPKPSEDYAGLVEKLRKGHVRYAAETQDEAAIRRNKERADAADALEALLAERDALKAELVKAQEITRMQAERIGWYINEQEKRDAVLKPRTSLAEAAAKERDALIARLAPVEDDALVEIAAYYFTDGSSWSALSERLRNICRRDARNVIAAIRPHIEAAERERCAKIAEEGEDGSCWTASERSIATAIRSGK